MRLLRLRTVLAATDLGGMSDAALDSAARLAAATGATLHVVHVVTEPEESLVRVGTSPRREQDVRSALHRAHADDARIHIIPGDPRSTIGPVGESVNADVIVMGRRSKEEPGAAPVVGGTATAVIRDTTVPCLVVSEPLQLPIDSVVIAVDASEAARGALVVAISWASALRRRTKGASPVLTAVHVDDGAGESSRDQETIDLELEEIRRMGGDWAGVSLTGMTISDADPITALSRYAAEVKPGLVVVGTRALGRPTHPALGSVASALARQLSAPVLLVPPAVWRAYARDLVA